ncbi:MAG: ferritin-like domain-containing protein, partial [Planctomycetes bacterium]|nr:ferritin-like domain-containing protein [Planctomycetota bacterium]
MLSTASIFQEIRSNDEAYRFFLSMAAKGETQGGWENERIAALSPDAELAPKIRCHAANESKHGRLFESLLHKRRLSTVDVPIEADYCMQLEGQGVGLSHERLIQETHLTVAEILEYLAH